MSQNFQSILLIFFGFLSFPVVVFSVLACGKFDFNSEKKMLTKPKNSKC